MSAMTKNPRVVAKVRVVVFVDQHSPSGAIWCLRSNCVGNRAPIVVEPRHVLANYTFYFLDRTFRSPTRLYTNERATPNVFAVSLMFQSLASSVSIIS